MSSTRARTIAVLIHTPDLDTAVAAGADLARTLDEVWIVGDWNVGTTTAPGIYRFTVHVVGPEHEIRADAPIVRRALGTCGWPADTVTVHQRRRTRTRR